VRDFAYAPKQKLPTMSKISVGVISNTLVFVITVLEVITKT